MDGSLKTTMKALFCIFKRRLFDGIPLRNVNCVYKLNLSCYPFGTITIYCSIELSIFLLNMKKALIAKKRFITYAGFVVTSKMPPSVNFDLKMFVDKSYNLLFSFQRTILQYTNVQLSANCKPLLLHLSMFL